MNKPRILICPLNWGLGHASRCIPVIRALLEAGAEPILAADEGPLDLLRTEFPQLEWLHFPGVSVRYPEPGESMVWSMLSQTPALLSGIKAETAFVKKLVNNYDIQAIVSDNRFGAYAKQVPSVYISHQILIKTGNALGDKMAFLQHRKYMQRYSRVWIPDTAGKPGLAGELSHGTKIPTHARYIGPLSRMKTLPNSEIKYDACLILSGPEPQRSVLESLFLEQIAGFPDKKFLLIRGKSEALGRDYPNLDCMGLAHQNEMEKALAESRRIICRSGYSGLMDLDALNRGACLIPTPGQTEQEYLAEQMKNKPGFICQSQNAFNLEQILTWEQEPVQEPIRKDQSLQLAVLELLDLCGK